MAAKDYFISYNQADLAWAEWIGWTLEEEGYSVTIQAWDSKVGENFIHWMDGASRETDLTIAVLSDNYLSGKFSRMEWTAALSKGKLLPIRIKEVDILGLLGPITYLDLVGLKEEEAKSKLLAQLNGSDFRPTHAPSFPVIDGRELPDQRTFPGSSQHRSAIRGLRPFGPDDAELFLQLERGDILNQCIESITDPEFRIGVLSAPSGTGKTSFVRAGLLPVLSKKHFCESIKFSEQDPLQSLIAVTQEFDPSAEISTSNFLDQLISLSANKPVVLFFDQFEQFFTHHTTKAARAPFLDFLVRWYDSKEEHAIKIIFSIRSDFYDHIIELQQTLGFSLAPHNNFRLEKFTPTQATRIFQVVANSAGLPFEETFVSEMTENELASKKDGRISPVDIQILGWMIRGYQAHSSSGINEETFLSIGGIEGLLESYLNQALHTRTKDQRRVDVHVLLNLIDRESFVRAGIKTLPDLQKNLSEIVNPDEVRESVTWLYSGEIRLISPTEGTNEVGFELIHERLIPAIMRLIDKEITEIDRVNQILERRTNEWLGNNKHKRYLLGRKELRLIRENKNFIKWGERKQAKNEFIERSKHKLTKWNITAATLILIISSFAGWSLYILKEFNYRQSLRASGLPAIIYDQSNQLESLLITGGDVNKGTGYITEVKWNNINIDTLGFNLLIGENQKIQLPESVDSLSINIITNYQSNIDNLLFPTNTKSLNLSGLKTFIDFAKLDIPEQLNQLSLDLSFSQTRSFEGLLLTDSIKKLSLNLSGTGIQSFEGMQLTENINQFTLDLYNTYLKSFEGLQLSDSINKLALDLSYTDIESFGGLQLTNNINQLSLDLDETPIQSFEGLQLTDSINQLSLNLRGTGIQSFEGLQLSDSINKLALDLSYTDIESFGGLQLTDSINQLSLNLGNTPISSFEGLQLTNNINQLSLNLNNTPIQSFEGLQLTDSINQLSLNLSGTGIQSFEGLQLSDSINQLTLILDDTQISSFEGLQLTNNINQLSLNLGNTPIQSFEGLQLTDSINQLTLILDDTQISSFEGLQLTNNINQLSLNLNNTPIQSFEGLQLTDSIYKLTLNLFHTQISSFEGLQLTDSINQLSLNLGMTLIQSFEGLLLTDSINQLSLNLGNTPIQSFEGLPLTDSINQLSLGLTGLQIRGFEGLTLTDSINQLSLYLGSRFSFSNSIQLPSLEGLLLTDNIEKLSLDLTNTQFHSLKELSYSDSLKFLEVSGPNLSTLPKLPPTVRTLKLRLDT